MKLLSIELISTLKNVHIWKKRSLPSTMTDLWKERVIRLGMDHVASHSLRFGTKPSYLC